MAHVRTQIRDRVASILLGTVTAGARVYKSRVDNMTADTMPGICVYTGDEVGEDGTLGSTMKTVDLIIDAYAAGASFDDEADLMQAQVEAKLYADKANNRYFNGLALLIAYDKSGKKYNGDAAVKQGVVRAIYKVTYETTDGNAETAN